ncbi:terminase large subunit [Gemmobacter lutimaris]|uniref:Terminase large subunit n=1 Tax=Gemmobacter lutimaris TaxID=2306023 RepID=A0A398BUJ6_9RHOB|nr:terminase large subunit [Gemmobacter lutimaris]RID91540.1 terminase large subunit [Gemmobacter lutimaris]
MSATEALPRFACPDWWQRLQAGDVPFADVPVNRARAGKALAFFNRLQLADQPGMPTLAEGCGEWFKAIVEVFFGSEDPETLLPQVWELLCMVPKKNSKTTYAGALGLTALMLEEAHNRQMLLVGPTQAISRRCFKQAADMIRASEKLLKIFHINDPDMVITRRATRTKLAVKTFATNIVTGEIPILTIIDEVHLLGAMPKAAAVMQQIRGGGITRQRGKILMITTQSDESPAGIWRTELDKARKIRDGKAGSKPIMLPVLYEFPAELQKNPEFWRDTRNWKLVLPNLGMSIPDEQPLIEDYENNGKINRHAEQVWASQHLNIEIGVGLSAGWAGAKYWDDAAQPGLTLDELIERSEVAVMGVDGGGLDDLFGVAVLGRCRETGDLLHWAKAWAHPDVLEERKEIAARLRGFADDGDLVLLDDENVSGDTDDVAEIASRLIDAGLLPEEDAIGVDTTNLAAIQRPLFRVGVTYEQLVVIGQDYRLSPAWWGMERMLKTRTFRHAGQPMMAWCVGNAKPEQKGSAMRITKEVAGKAKIDPLVATAQAVILMARNPEAGGAGTVITIPEDYVVG